MICPNCGAKLPDTAMICYSCRTQFQKQQPINQPNNPVQQQTINKTVVLSCILGLIGACLYAIGVFPPFFSVSSTFSISHSLYPFHWGFIVSWILAVVFIIFSIPGRKYTTFDAIVKIIFSLIGIGLFIYYTIYIYRWFNDTYYDSSSLSFGIGFYIMLFGNLLMIISGLILPLGLDTNET